MPPQPVKHFAIHKDTGEPVNESIFYVSLSGKILPYRQDYRYGIFALLINDEIDGTSALVYPLTLSSECVLKGLPQDRMYQYLNIRDAQSVDGYPVKENLNVPDEWTLEVEAKEGYEGKLGGAVCLAMPNTIDIGHMKMCGHLTQESWARFMKLEVAFRFMGAADTAEEEQEAVGDFTFFLKGREEYDQYLAAIKHS